MKIFGTFIFLMLFVTASIGQYYYNDIIATNQTNNQFALLTTNHIKKVTAESREADGSLTPHFFLQQVLNQNGTEITTVAEYPSTGNSIFIAQYSDNKISQSIDSVDKIRSVVNYTYNENKLNTITTTTEDKSMNIVSYEEHHWFYDGNLPTKMWVIKNGKDTTIVHFIKEENGNIGEEHWYKNGVKVQNYFYYYNEKQQLTDVVKFNTRAERLLPEFLFTYDEAGNISSFTQVSGTGNYTVWKYIYLSNGLKQKEVLFNKEKQLVGTIEFTYN